MSNKDREILEDLSNLYINIYKNKDLYNDKFLKYNPQDVKEVVNRCLRDTPQKEKEIKIRDEILNIKSEEEAYKFYINNLMRFNNDIEKKKALSNFSIDELKYLYSIILSTPLKKSVTKSGILDIIRNYFDSINRVKSMKL